MFFVLDRIPPKIRQWLQIFRIGIERKVLRDPRHLNQGQVNAGIPEKRRCSGLVPGPQTENHEKNLRNRESLPVALLRQQKRLKIN
jgi:hypothetical protein